MRRYLSPSLHARAGQPARFASLSPLANSYGIDACWAMFGDGSAFAGGVRLPSRGPRLYSPVYTAHSPIGRALNSRGCGQGPTDTISTPEHEEARYEQFQLTGPRATAFFNIYNAPGVANQNEFAPVNVSSGSGYYIRAGMQTVGSGWAYLTFRFARAYTQSNCSYAPAQYFKGVVVMVFDSGTWTVYANGNPVAPSSTLTDESTVGLTDNATFSSMPAVIGGGTWVSLIPTNMVGFCMGAWSPDKVRAFSANPWQVFA